MSDTESPKGNEDPILPPASFSMLVSMLGTQAMIALGQMTDPSTGKSNPRINLARHYIDTLNLLEDKTKNNLTSEESALLNGILHDLRMAFVVSNKSKA